MLKPPELMNTATRLLQRSAGYALTGERGLAVSAHHAALAVAAAADALDRHAKFVEQRAARADARKDEA